jgi:hypothetical protein
MIKPARESVDVSNGFLVGYRGYGCFTVVTINVQFQDGQTETLYFDMCEAVGQ